MWAVEGSLKCTEVGQKLVHDNKVVGTILSGKHTRHRHRRNGVISKPALASLDAFAAPKPTQIQIISPRI